MMRFFFQLLIVVVASLLCGADISRNLENVMNSKNTIDEKINIWIYFKDKNIIDLDNILIDIENKANISQKNRRAKVREVLFDERDIPVNINYINKLIEDSNISLRSVSNWLNAISVSIPIAFIDKLHRFEFVDKLDIVKAGKRINESIKKNINVINRNNYGPSHNQLEQINVIEAHENGYKGQGVKMLILDTGFYTEHESINENNILDEWDFINSDSETQNEEGDHGDQHNHGTYILSVIGGAKEEQLYGPAYESNFFLAKTEDLTQEQPIEEDWFVAALEWGESLGADISSSSLGYIDWYDYEDLDGQTAVTTIGINIATENGMVCVTSAGNSGNDGIIAPADAFEVISVGAVDWNGELTWFSSRGPTADGRIKPEVCARGLDTYCAVPSYDQYAYVSGTSLSCPLVSGACAVILSARPEWPNYMVRNALLNTANNATNPNNDYGWGIINVMDAIHYFDGTGDINYDGVLNILDILVIVNIIIQGDTIDDIGPGNFDIIDANEDGIINILDIMYFISIILSGN